MKNPFDTFEEFLIFMTGFALGELALLIATVVGGHWR